MNKAVDAQFIVWRDRAESAEAALRAISNINITPKTAVSVAMAMRRIAKEALAPAECRGGK